MAEGVNFSTEHYVQRKPVRYLLKAYVVSRGRKKDEIKFETRLDLEFEDDEEIVELKRIYS